MIATAVVMRTKRMDMPNTPKPAVLASPTIASSMPRDLKPWANTPAAITSETTPDMERPIACRNTLQPALILSKLNFQRKVSITMPMITHRNMSVMMSSLILLTT